MSKNQRSFKNWFIAPDIKFKYIFYSLVFGGFSIALFQVILIKWLDIQGNEFISSKLVFFLFAYFSLCCLFGIWMSHTFIGPMVAFKRHINELKIGNYKVKTKLRKGDEFTDIMDSLNDLSDILRK